MRPKVKTDNLAFNLIVIAIGVFALMTVCYATLTLERTGAVDIFNGGMYIE